MDPTNSKLPDAHPFPGTSPVAGVASKPAAPALPEAPAPHHPVDQPNPDLPDTLKTESHQPVRVDAPVQEQPPVEAVPAQHEAVPPDPAHAHAQPVPQHAVAEHVHDGEPPQHMHEIPEELHHDLQQGEEVAHAEGHMADDGKEAVAVQQQDVAHAQEGVHPSEHVQGGAGEVVQGHRQEDAMHTHAEEIPVHEVPHEQVQQQMEGEDVQHPQHHAPMQQERVVHPAEHAQGEKMEDVMQQPVQEAAQQLEQEHDHAQMHAPGQQPAQEQYQEHVAAEHHEQPQDQLAEQQQMQSQEQLVEHHPEHAQGQVQEHQVADHQQVAQAQDVQGRLDAEQQQMNPALATAAAAASAAGIPSEKMVYEQVLEHARYQQSPIATPVHSSRRGPDSSPDTTPRRGAERYHASGEQLRTLVDAFDQDPTPSVQTLNFLSSSIGMPMHNLVLWFKNRRARHKKTHPNQPLKTGRRSYVKSGIYSRAKRAKQQQHIAASGALPTTMQQTAHPQLPAGVMLPPDPIDGQAVPDLPQDQKQEVQNSIGPGAKRPPDEHGLVGPTVSKRAKYAGVKELIGDENPCRLWDGQECHRRCIEFFERMSGGCHPEQTDAARIVCDEFFLSELQSGLTMTSAMQPLEMSVAILDNIMDRLPADGPKLSSGSRVILREFFAQIRSGNAATVQAEASMEEAGDNVAGGEEAGGEEAGGEEAGENEGGDNEARNSMGGNAAGDNAGGDSAAGEQAATDAAAPPGAAPEEQQTQ